MAKHEADEAAVERLRRDIARDRLRVAQAAAIAPELTQTDAAAEGSTRVGRLHRIFTLLGEC